MFKFAYKDINFSHKLDFASDPTDDYHRHMHAFNELIYFVDGDAYYTVESDSVHLQKGDFIFIPSGRYHFANINKKVAYDRYILQFPNSMIPSFLVQKMYNANPFYGSHKELQTLFSQLDSYCENFTDEELYVIFLCDLIKILIIINKDHTDMGGQHNGMIAPIIKYIDENIQSKITIESLSKEFNYSKSYLSNTFKKAMNVPLMQYVRTKKIIAAHNMLLAGGKKGEIAELFGFKDYSTFYRAYVNVMGFPPSGHKDTPAQNG